MGSRNCLSVARPRCGTTELEFEDGTTDLASVDLACSGDGGDD